MLAFGLANASFEKAYDKRTVMRRVAHDRYTFAMWKQGTLRFESITIGNPGLDARYVTTRHFKYDPSMRVDASE